jgi:hypothetical protein
MLSEIMLSTFFGTFSSSAGLACNTLPNQIASGCVNPSILFDTISRTLQYDTVKLTLFYLLAF